jgi:hypothetical protein
MPVIEFTVVPVSETDNTPTTLGIVAILPSELFNSNKPEVESYVPPVTVVPPPSVNPVISTVVPKFVCNSRVVVAE